MTQSGNKSRHDKWLLTSTALLSFVSPTVRQVANRWSAVVCDLRLTRLRILNQREEPGLENMFFDETVMRVIPMISISSGRQP